MNKQLRQATRVALLAAAAMIAGTAGGADGDQSFNAAVEQYRHRTGTPDEWQNTWMPSGTRLYAAQSADKILTASLRIYTRDVLDRGHWVSHFVGDAPGYASGNPLLAVAPGTGVSSHS